MGRFISWAGLIAGVAAAYLMYRRGASVGEIATKATSNPVGALASEVRQGV